MSDPFSVGLDEDPAADFLAREQQELAGLEDDGFGGLASDSPAAGEANQENPAVSGDGLDLFGVGDVAVVATSDSVPVQDFFGGDTDFGGSGSSSLSTPPLLPLP